MNYDFIINSTYTPNMLKRMGGNNVSDSIITWDQIESAVNVWNVSPSNFYIIGVGFIKITNCFGHQSTSDLIKARHNIIVPCNRATVNIDCGFIVVPQYRGIRLPEGATELPSGSKLVPMINVINGTKNEKGEDIINFSFYKEGE